MGFKDLEVECVARTISAAYSLNLMMLLCRVQFNIVSRDLASEGAKAATSTAAAPAEALETSSDEGGDKTQEGDAYARFLESTKHLEETGIRQVAEAVRRAVAAKVEELKVFPQTAVSAETTEKFFMEVCDTAAAEVLSSSSGVTTLLPEALDSELARSDEKVKAMLDEARDYLESPQFGEALRAVLAAAMKRLVGTLGDGAQDPSKSLLGEGKSAAFARLFGPIMELSNTIFSPEEGNEFVSQFAQDSVVTELCEALFAQDTADAEEEGEEVKCPQQ